MLRVDVAVVAGVDVGLLFDDLEEVGRVLGCAGAALESATRLVGGWSCGDEGSAGEERGDCSEEHHGGVKKGCLGLVRLLIMLW